MPRGQPTKADLDLIAAADAAGVVVTRRQIEDWRIAGALPPRTVESLGRYGRRSHDPPGTAARLLAVCDFMFKTGRLVERPDVPRRRKVSDALLWIWYAGYNVPATEVRDLLSDRLNAVGTVLESMRAAEAKTNPGLPTYEIEQAAAERVANHHRSTPGFRRLARTYRKQPGHEQGANPGDELAGGIGQIIQMLDSTVEGDANALTHLFDLGAHLGQPSGSEPDPEWLQVLQARLSLERMRDAMRRPSDAEWAQVRLILHTWNTTGDTQQWPRSLLFSTTPRLVSAAGYAVVLLPEIRRGLKDRFGIELDD